MGFNDFAQAIQFGSGLISGFQKQTQELQDRHEKQQLALLNLLSHDKTKSVESVLQDDIVGEQGFFGGGALKTKDGQPVYKIGGNAFTVKPRPMLGGGEDETMLAPPSPTKAEPVTPLKPLDSFTIAPESPAAPSAPAAPGAKSARDAMKPELRNRIYAAVRKEIAAHPNVSFEEALGIIDTESKFDPQATSPKGAQGLMQLMPATAAGLGVKDSYSVEENIRGGIQHYSRLKEKYKGSQELALAAYNAGEGRVDKLGRVPNIPETQAYVQKVPAAQQAFTAGNSPPAPPTARSTPEQDAAYRASHQPSAPTPDTSMMVAGPGAPAPRSEFTLPPATTVEEAQRVAAQRVRQRYKGAQTPEEMHEFRTATTAATEKAFTHWHQEQKEVAGLVKDLRAKVHDPRILDALDQVKTTAQFDAVKNLIAATPEQDHLSSAIDYMEAAQKKSPEAAAAAAVHVWQTLRRANYDDKKDIQRVFELSGFTDKKAVELAGKKAVIQQQAEIDATPAKLAAALPGTIKLEEAKAGIIKPVDADIPAITAEWQRDLELGKVPPGTSMSDYLKTHSGLLVKLQKDRELANLPVDAAQIENARKRYLESGRYTADSPVIKALDQRLENLARTPEEIATTAADKAAVVTEARATATQKAHATNVQAAGDAVEKLLSGEVPPPEGVSVDNAALKELTKHNLTPAQMNPTLAGRIEEARPYRALTDRTSWVGANYENPNVDSTAEGKNKGLAQVPREELAKFRLGNDLHMKMRRIEETMEALGNFDPTFKQFSLKTGGLNRLALAGYIRLATARQADPKIAAFLDAINNDLKDVTINYGRFISGIGGRPSTKLIEETTKSTPNMDPKLFTWLHGTKQLDSPDKILTQLGLMQDMVRTAQDEVLSSTGVITPQEATNRRQERMDFIAHPEKRQIAQPTPAAAATTTPPAAAATTTPPAPAAPPAKAKGQQEFEDMMQRGKQ